MAGTNLSPEPNLDLHTGVLYGIVLALLGWLVVTMLGLSVAQNHLFYRICGYCVVAGIFSLAGGYLLRRGQLLFTGAMLCIAGVGLPIVVLFSWLFLY